MRLHCGHDLASVSSLPGVSVGVVPSAGDYFGVLCSSGSSWGPDAVVRLPLVSLSRVSGSSGSSWASGCKARVYIVGLGVASVLTVSVAGSREVL